MKSRFFAIICTILSLMMLLSACGGNNPVVTEPVSTDPVVTEPAETERELPPVEPGVVKTLDIGWHVGYVASFNNLKATSILMDGEEHYAYSDVFTIPHAGTKITFVDDNAGATKKGYVSDQQYVFSLWDKNADGKWELDGAMNYKGSLMNNSVVAKSENGKMVYTYVTENNWENIRVCYHAGTTSNFVSVTAEYTGEDSTWDKFYLDNKDFYDWLEGNRKTTYYKELEGLTLNIMGDSYFAGHNNVDKYQVWPGILAQKYGMSFVNHGINGSTVTTVNAAKNPMVERYVNLPDNDPDIIIIEGGRNDWSNKSLMGSNTSQNPLEFKGALNIIIDGLQKKYPDALIIGVTAWYNGESKNVYGYRVSDYAKAMIDICALQGIPCFDATNQEKTGVYITDGKFQKEYGIVGDVSHLNLKGMQKVMPVFEKFIYDEWVKFNNK